LVHYAREESILATARRCMKKPVDETQAGGIVRLELGIQCGWFGSIQTIRIGRP